MKKFLLVMLGAIMALPTMAQTEFRKDGVIYNLFKANAYVDAYACVIGNFLTEKTDITIPASVSNDGVDFPVTEIKTDAFQNCEYLTSVVTPKSITSIVNEAFAGCSNLVSVTIPESVTTIGERVFKGCSSLTSVNIPKSVTTIKHGLFDGCVGLTAITIPETVTSIESSAFFNCSGLTSFIIPETVTFIGYSTFYGCSGLTSITIPKSVTTIWQRTFENCSGLISVTIPETIEGIGTVAFAGCQSLKDIYYLTSDPVEADYSVFSEEAYETAILYVAKGGLEKAKKTSPWDWFKNIKEYDSAAIEDLTANPESNSAISVYNLNGVKVNDATDNLPAGIYIIRQGNIIKKVAVK